MLKELTECGNNIKEEVKVTQSETKKNLQGTTSGWKETGIQINDLEHKEKKTQSEQQEEKRFQKNKGRKALLGQFQDGHKEDHTKTHHN